MSRNLARQLEAPNYGRIAGLYRWLEYAAFGQSLQRSRETFLDRLEKSRRIALFGAGDGRCFAPLLRAAPSARIDSYDIDAVMINFSQKRVAALNANDRVAFHHADARTEPLAAGIYDAVITQYFLDCFPADELDRLISKISTSLNASGIWLFADFTVPLRPALARWRARATIALLCRFFRWQVNHPLLELPPMEEKLRAQGWVCIAKRTGSWGMVKSEVYQRIR